MLATTSLVVLSLLIPLAKAVSTIPRDRAISNAELRAQALVPAIAANPEPVRLQRVVDQVNDLNNDTVSVLLPDGHILGAPFSPSPSVAVAKQGQSLNAQIPGGVEVLTPAFVQGQTYVVRIVVDDGSLTKGVRSAWAILGVLGVLLIMVAVAVADRLARSIVKPITALAATTRSLAEGQLDARVDPAGPTEVREVGTTLNLLADRIGDLLVTEREAVADLSHRLRTPITALRLDAEALTNPAEVRRITADIDELTQAVDQLIRTARQPTQNSASSCELVHVLTERASFWQVLAEDQQREMIVDLPTGPFWVGLSEDDLAAAVDALIGNVFSHTEEDTAFSIQAKGQRDRVVVLVDDCGGGLSEESEVRGVSGSGSTGLGISIVRSTMELAGGSFTLSDSPLGGARARFELPLVRTGRSATDAPAQNSPKRR